MSNKKNKISHNFRLDPETTKIVKELAKSDPSVYRSQAQIVDAALYHFVKLSKPEQKKLIAQYLTKDL